MSSDEDRSASLPVMVPPSAEGLARQEALQAYMAQVKRYPLLSPEKELEIAMHYFKTKDPASAQALVLANLRLVVKIAHEYMRSGFHLLDLIQEGNMGLLQAVREFDPHRGVKLSSYASYWIKAYIRAFILKNWSLVKIGTTKAQRTLFYKLAKEKAHLEALGKPPEPKYLAERLDVKEEEVVEMSQRMGGRDISLNAPVRNDDSQSDALQQFLEDHQESAVEHLARHQIESEFLERLNAFERTLSGKELVIFRERMRAEAPKTLQEIGDTYHITRERVRQIEARVMEKLRDYMKQHARFMKPTS